MTVIILAGGRAKRMRGCRKALLTFKGETFIRRKIRLLSPLAKEILVVVSNPSNFTGIDARIIEDKVQGRGPLMGMYSGLISSTSYVNFITTVDSPLFSIDLIKYLADSREEYDAHVPRWRGYIEPLFGIYTKKCIPAIHENLENRKIVSFYPAANIKFAEERKVAEIDPEGISFININTPEEYRKLLEITPK